MCGRPYRLSRSRRRFTPGWVFAVRRFLRADVWGEDRSPADQPARPGMDQWVSLV